MSRIRTIKPDFFLDDELAELTPLTRLLFIGLWTLADCEGRLEDRPKRIRAQIHPFDDGDTDAMLQALHDRGFIHRYTAANGLRCIEIRSFKKHQRLSGKEAEGQSLIPPRETSGSDGEATGKQRGSDGARLESQEGKGKEGKGREEEGRKETRVRAKPAPAPKTPFPPDLSITPELQAWASAHGYTEDLQRHLDHFRDKAIAKGYQYADWQAALRNAIRDDWAGLRKPTSAAIPGHAPGDKRAGLVSRNGDALSDWLGGGDITVSPPPAAKELAHETH